MRTVTAMLLLFTFVLYTKQQVTPDPVYAAALDQNHTECAKEAGVDVGEVNKIWADPSYPANNEALKCYYKCMANKLGFIDNGKYDNVDGAKVFAHFDTPDELKEIQAECSNLPANKDDCEFAYQVYKCVAEAELD